MFNKIKSFLNASKNTTTSNSEKQTINKQQEINTLLNTNYINYIETSIPQFTDIKKFRIAVGSEAEAEKVINELYNCRKFPGLQFQYKEYNGKPHIRIFWDYLERATPLQGEDMKNFVYLYAGDGQMKLEYKIPRDFYYILFPEKKPLQPLTPITDEL